MRGNGLFVGADFSLEVRSAGGSVASLSTAALAESEAAVRSVWEGTLRRLMGTYPPLDDT